MPRMHAAMLPQASGSVLRRALSRLEHGVCQLCGLDCTALVRQLQAIRIESRNYLDKRCGAAAAQHAAHGQ